MRKDRLFQILVIADIALATLTIAAEFAFHRTLPEALRAYAWTQYVGNWNFTGVALFFLWIVLITATIISWIGLLLYWWPARAFYVGAWVAMLVMLLASGPSVLTAPGAALDTLEHVVGGILIGMMYFSDDVRQRFEESDLEPVAA